MKITLKQLEEILNELGTLLNKATSKEVAISSGQTKFLQLDYAPIYGGYRLVNVSVEGGGHSGAFGRGASDARISPKEMYQYLSGLVEGVHFSNLK